MDVVIGLGANQGNWAEAFGLVDDALQPVRRSSLWASAPVGGPPQEDFVNAAMLLQLPVEAADGAASRALLGLLRRLQDLEWKAGRRRSVRWGPRPLDLDILWASGPQVSASGLLVPHPRLVERAFALRPLLELCPGAVLPVTGIRLESFLARTNSQRICRLDGCIWRPSAPSVGPPPGQGRQ